MPPHANTFKNSFLEPIELECMTPKTPAQHLLASAGLRSVQGSSTPDNNNTSYSGYETSMITGGKGVSRSRSRAYTRTFSIPAAFNFDEPTDIAIPVSPQRKTSTLHSPQPTDRSQSTTMSSEGGLAHKNDPYPMSPDMFSPGTSPLPMDTKNKAEVYIQLTPATVSVPSTTKTPSKTSNLQPHNNNNSPAKSRKGGATSSSSSSSHHLAALTPRRHSFSTPCAKSMPAEVFFHANKFRPTANILDMLHSVDGDKLGDELAHQTSDKSWKSVGLKQGVNIQRMKNTVRGYVDIPASCTTTPMSVDFVCDFIFNTNPVLYNEGVEFATRLYTHDDGHGHSKVLLYQSFHGAFGFPGRDFFLVATRKCMDPKTKNHIVFSCKSVEIPDMESGGPLAQKYNNFSGFILPGRVHGLCEIGGYDVKRLPNNDIRVTAIWELDLKVSLPGFIMNNLQNQTLYHLTPLVKLIIQEHEAGRNNNHPNSKKK